MGQLNGSRLRLVPFAGATMFPPRAPFFEERLGPRAARVTAWAEERDRGNLAVSPKAPSPHRPEVGR
jgi:hypothetical protein